MLTLGSELKKNPAFLFGKYPRSDPALDQDFLHPVCLRAGAGILGAQWPGAFSVGVRYRAPCYGWSPSAARQHDGRGGAAAGTRVVPGFLHPAARRARCDRLGRDRLYIQTRAAAMASLDVDVILHFLCPSWNNGLIVRCFQVAKARTCIPPYHSICVRPLGALPWRVCVSRSPCRIRRHPSPVTFIPFLVLSNRILTSSKTFYPRNVRSRYRNRYPSLRL